MSLAHFIVPTTAHDPDMVGDCLAGLIEQRGSRIVLVVNTDWDFDPALCRSLVARGYYLTLVEIPEAIGYTRACNIGLDAANANDDDIIVVLNDDTIATGDLVTPIAEALAGGDAKLVGPSVRFVGRDGYWGKGNEPYLFVEGWCAAARLNTLKRAGGLYDEAFSPGYCEDMDLSIRVQKIGGQIGQVHLPIRHLRSRTYGHDRPWWQRNREYLVRKHNLT